MLPPIPLIIRLVSTLLMVPFLFYLLHYSLSSSSSDRRMIVYDSDSDFAPANNVIAFENINTNSNVDVNHIAADTIDHSSNSELISLRGTVDPITTPDIAIKINEQPQEQPQDQEQEQESNDNARSTASSFESQSQSQRTLVVDDGETGTQCTLYVAQIKYHTEEEEEVEGRDRETDDEEQVYCEFNHEYARTVLGLEDPLVEVKGFTASSLHVSIQNNKQSFTTAASPATATATASAAADNTAADTAATGRTTNELQPVSSAVCPSTSPDFDGRCDVTTTQVDGNNVECGYHYVYKGCADREEELVCLPTLTCTCNLFRDDTWACSAKAMVKVCPDGRKGNRKRGQSCTPPSTDNEEETVAPPTTPLLHIESGATTMTFRQGIVDPTDNTIYVNPSSIMRMDDVPTTTVAAVVDRTNHDRSVTPRTSNGNGMEAPQRPPPTTTTTTTSRTMGIKQTLVVRISNSEGIEPLVTREELYQSVFSLNQISLKQKYEECSYGKLIIQPYAGIITSTTGAKTHITDGILDVTLSPEQTQKQTDDPGRRGRDTNFARVATIKLLFGEGYSDKGTGTLDEVFDFVLFVMPGTVKSFVAMAIANRYDSYYTQKYILRPSYQLHEVGHNLGLKHAGEYGVTNTMYGDKTGYMGSSYATVDGPSMCFNVANNYKLQWYTEQTYTYNPFLIADVVGDAVGGDTITTKQFILNGVDDYRNETTTNVNNGGVARALQQQQEPKRLIVLRLEQSDVENDFYIGYNSDKGMNVGTFENKNAIVIVEKMGAPDSTMETKKRATLQHVGEYYAIDNYNHQNIDIVPSSSSSPLARRRHLETTTTVYILFQALSTNGNDATIVISTTEPLLVPSTESPTTSPTASPTTLPTASPSESPTKSPTTLPTASPTTSPTEEDFVIGDNKDNDIIIVPQVKVDNRTFTYKDNPEKNCQWIQNIHKKNHKKTRKVQKRKCRKKWEEKIVQEYWCPETCQEIFLQ